MGHLSKMQLSICQWFYEQPQLTQDKPRCVIFWVLSLGANVKFCSHHYLFIKNKYKMNQSSKKVTDGLVR